MGVIIVKIYYERWDGKGYFDGLVGDDIFIEGCIMVIVDVVDVFLLKWCYKFVWSGS